MPGHWEGDLVVGRGNRSAIGTLVDRTTRYVKLLHLPDGRTAEHVPDALLHAFADLPAELARSLTWDQGSEMCRHDEFSRASGIPVYFCEPASPLATRLEREHNGLLRQYFPKGTDLSVHTAEDLAVVAAELNDRPRKILDWQTPGRVASRGEAIVPLVGARRRDRLDESLGFADVTLDEETLAEIERAVPSEAASGERYAAGYLATLDSEGA